MTVQTLPHTLHVTVEQRHLDRGHSVYTMHGPAALALSELLPDVPVEVHHAGRIQIESDSQEFIYRVTSDPAGFDDVLWRFSEGLPVQPFSFDMEVVPWQRS